MPIYEYRCSNGHTFEVTQSMADDPPETCEVCGASVERVFHPIAVHFKGSGFYTTDYANKGKSGGASEGGDSGGSGESSDKSKPDSSDSSDSSSSEKKSDSGKSDAGKSDSVSKSKAASKD
jgi:putative FmdB family regulatory protein